MVSELTARFLRARSQHARAGRARAVEIFEELIAWMNDNGKQIAPTHPVTSATRDR